MLQYYILAAGVSYLIGSIPFGFLIAKTRGIDIRKHGSGNIGATNVYRVVGEREGVITLILDFGKGVIPVALFSSFFQKVDHIGVVSAVFTVLGHDFSVFLLFKGGKGVATSYGATLPIFPLASLVGIFIWILTLLVTKYSSLAALLSFLVATIIALTNSDCTTKLLFVFLYLIMIFRHKENLKRLFEKKERRIKI